MNVTILFSTLNPQIVTSTPTATIFTWFRGIVRLEKKNASVCHLCPARGTTGLKDSLFLHRFLALAEAAIVPIILVTLGVPVVVVVRSQMYVGLISRIADEVMEVKRFSRVPPELTISSPVASSPIVAGVAITWAVLLVHVEPQALHGVSVQDVSKGEGVSQFPSMGEVLTIVSALGPVHHQGVGANIGSASTLSTPVGGGR